MSRAYGGVLRADIAYATGFVVETGLFCAYTCLFIAALPGMTSARRLKNPHSARSGWVFLIVSILMYIVATLHLMLAAFRFYKSIFLHVDPNGAISYFGSSHHWEYLGLVILFCIQTWLGDALVIYRCYFVWESNLLIIVVPVCLLLASVVVNICVWYQILHPGTFTVKIGTRIFRCIYPFAFAQNFLTTSFIIFKIYLQHRVSKKAGVVHTGSTHSLIRIMRIVIESAALYTIQLLILIILFVRRDNVQIIIWAAINPSIGITFVLLAIRIQTSRITNATSGTNLGVNSTLIPRWLRNTESDDGIDCGDHRGDGLQQATKGGTEIANVQKLQESSHPDNWDRESSANSAKQSKAAVLNA